MELLKKLKILADAAKFDVSCSSSGSSRKNTGGGLGNAAPSGICHSWSTDGRCISLLKILFTNFCIYDCAYCVNRSSNDIPRAGFTPDEVARLTINFYRRNYIEGLFLSSAIKGNPNHTMELLLETVRKLRRDHKYNGYIHLKAIPGADQRLISEAGTLVDRMSVNIELPSSEGLKLLAPQKKKDAILKPMGLIGSQIIQYQAERKISKKVAPFVPAGQSTQLIIGATRDSDYKIIKLSENLYHKFSLKRVYYSAYVPVSANPILPSLTSAPLQREHRLYQADWLLRFYGFTADDLFAGNKHNLDLELDPKSQWALHNLHRFPVEVNQADYETLLRVPGIGVRSAQRIVAARRMGALSFDSLTKFGVVLKRARYFITCRGKYFGDSTFTTEHVRQGLLPALKSNHLGAANSNWEQLTLWPELPAIYSNQEFTSTITGEF